MRTLLLALALAGCVQDPPAASHALEASGFRDVQTTGYSWGVCGKDDWSSTGFTAINAQGQRVTGAVCCGLWLKGCTVRF